MKRRTQNFIFKVKLCPRQKRHGQITEDSNFHGFIKKSYGRLRSITQELIEGNMMFFRMKITLFLYTLFHGGNRVLCQ
jgi:hypothetical protein